MRKTILLFDFFNHKHIVQQARQFTSKGSQLRGKPFGVCAWLGMRDSTFAPNQN